MVRWRILGSFSWPTRLYNGIEVILRKVILDEAEYILIVIISAVISFFACYVLGVYISVIELKRQRWRPQLINFGGIALFCHHISRLGKHFSWIDFVWYHHVYLLWLVVFRFETRRHELRCSLRVMALFRTVKLEPNCLNIGMVLNRVIIVINFDIINNGILLLLSLIIYRYMLVLW